MSSPKLLSNSVCFCGGDNGRFGRTDRTMFDDENSSRRTSLVAILSDERKSHYFECQKVIQHMTEFVWFMNLDCSIDILR